MLVMYSMFTKNPTKESLETIINSCKEIVTNALTDIKGTGYTEKIAKAYSGYWLHVDDDPKLMSNRNKIDIMFKEILLDVDGISKYSISNEARAVYLHVIDEYSKKISNVYEL
jgi:hypothetical protein